jgi:hypothetical protein
MQKDWFIEIWCLPWVGCPLDDPENKGFRIDTFFGHLTRWGFWRIEREAQYYRMPRGPYAGLTYRRKRM